MDFRSRQLARAELLLEPVDADTLPRVLVVARFDVEECQPVGASGCAFWSGERERHVRVDRRGEPLAAVQPPAAVDPRARSFRVFETSEPPLVSVIHCPEIQCCAGSRVSSCGSARSISCAIAGGLDRRRRAVAHRERAGVELAGAMKQVDERKLVHARTRAERWLVSGRDEAEARRDRLRGAPGAASARCGRRGCPRRPIAAVPAPRRGARARCARRRPHCRRVPEGRIRSRRASPARVRDADMRAGRVIAILIAELRRGLHECSSMVLR